VLVGACSAPQTVRRDRPQPELVLWGGDVRTMDPAHPHATALAISGGQIIAVGADAEIRALHGVREVALRGKTVTPGLIDAHCHLYGLGIDLESVSVRGTRSAEAAAGIVADAARARPAGEWLIGRGWDQNLWATPEFPSRAVLDEKSADLRSVPDGPNPTRNHSIHPPQAFSLFWF
jgi:predicted amidohydrolase YtcJ